MSRGLFIKGFITFFLIIGFAVISGCVIKDTQSIEQKTVFFPPPPDLPRYQFLTSFQGTDDFQSKASGLDSFLGGGQQGYKLKKPYGVAMNNGAMYVADSQSSVWKFDLVKEKVSKISGDKGLGKLVQPINLTIDSEGNKYVADPVRSAIIKYDKNDFYVKAYVSLDKWKPVAAQIYEQILYVVDATHYKGGIVVFDLKSGQQIDKLGQSGPEEHRLHIPTNMTFDRDGYLYVLDAGRFEVVKYDRDGHYRGTLGAAGSSPGFFGRPRGISIDRDGRMYVVDAAFDVVQVFAPNGQVLTILGGPGTSPGTLTLPAGIFIDYEHVELFKKHAAPGFEIEYLVFVTSQFHDTNAISVYGYGRMADKKYPSDEVLVEELIEKLERERAQAQ